MCGITGFFETKTGRARSELHVIAANMNAALTHRGPDSGDLWQDPDLPLALAHRRLAIIDLSSDGAQPMLSASERFVLSYNGEIYNFESLRTQLEDTGFVFKGRSDTEVILAAIEHWGLNQALQKINGMFAIALWDRKERILHLVRDRLGKKPLYLGWAGSSFVFASELKALHTHPDFEKAINREAVALFLHNKAVPAPHCIFENIWQLGPGQRISLDMQTLRPGEDLSKNMARYWDALDHAKSAKDRHADKSDETILRDFEELLEQCVTERMISDVPLGAFLSGGIDSSSIVALMQKHSSQPIKTYTIGFEEAGFDEAVYAKQIAAHLGTDHHEHICSAHDALDIIPSLPEMYDEPFADQSAIPTYLVSRFAKDSVTVALSGDGGDEMLGGYTRHITGPQLWKRIQMLPAPARKIMASAIKSIKTGHWDKMRSHHPAFGAHMHKAARMLSLDTQEDIYARLLNPWESPPMRNAEHYEAIPLAALPSDFSFAEKMMLWDVLGYLPTQILTKVDRASMATALEVRAPLLDKRIFEYVWQLPEHMKIRGGKGKHLLRALLKEHVPENLFERNKQGFNIPLESWLRGPLRAWGEELLRPEKLAQQGLLDVEVISENWARLQKEQGNHAESLWSVLMFQAWYEKWMV